MGVMGINNLFVNIEMYFDHYANEDVSKDIDKGQQGKAFCFVSGGNARALAVCKSLGKEARDNTSYWL